MLPSEWQQRWRSFAKATGIDWLWLGNQIPIAGDCRKKGSRKGLASQRQHLMTSFGLATAMDWVQSSNSNRLSMLCERSNKVFLHWLCKSNRIGSSWKEGLASKMQQQYIPLWREKGLSLEWKENMIILGLGQQQRMGFCKASKRSPSEGNRKESALESQEV